MAVNKKTDVFSAIQLLIFYVGSLLFSATKRVKK